MAQDTNSFARGHELFRGAPLSALHLSHRCTLMAQDTNSFARGHELFRGGLLTEAVLALEAEVQRTPGNVPAWLLLGTIQAENDDDLQVGAHITGSRCHTSFKHALASIVERYTTTAAKVAGLVRQPSVAGARGRPLQPGTEPWRRSPAMRRCCCRWACHTPMRWTRAARCASCAAGWSAA